MDVLLKSEHFQPPHTNFIHSETFLLKMMHRFRLFFRSKAMWFTILYFKKYKLLITQKIAYAINFNKKIYLIKII